MLALQTRVPERVAQVEAERAALLPHVAQKVVCPRKQLHRQRPELARDGARLVDDGADARGVLVEDHAGDERAVLAVLLAQVQVRDVPDRLEGARRVDAGRQHAAKHLGGAPVVVAETQLVVDERAAAVSDRLCGCRAGRLPAKQQQPALPVCDDRRNARLAEQQGEPLQQRGQRPGALCRNTGRTDGPHGVERAAIQNAHPGRPRAAEQHWRTLAAMRLAAAPACSDAYFRLALDQRRQARRPWGEPPIDRQQWGPHHAALRSRFAAFFGEVAVGEGDFLAALNHPRLDASNAERFFAWRAVGRSALALACREHVVQRFPDAAHREASLMVARSTSAAAQRHLAQACGVLDYYEGLHCEEAYDALCALVGAHHRAGGAAGLRQRLAQTLLAGDWVSDGRGLFAGRSASERANQLLQRQGRPRADLRLAAESGRGTDSAVFLVRAYSGTQLLGEGAGSTLQLAKREAMHRAFHRLTLTPNESAKFPTEAPPGSLIDEPFRDSSP